MKLLSTFSSCRRFLHLDYRHIVRLNLGLFSSPLTPPKIRCGRAADLPNDLHFG